MALGIRSNRIDYRRSSSEDAVNLSGGNLSAEPFHFLGSKSSVRRSRAGLLNQINVRVRAFRLSSREGSKVRRVRERKRGQRTEDTAAEGSDGPRNSFQSTIMYYRRSSSAEGKP